ncbi:RSP_7527 family protein [Marinomonas shanghaiensis]|uniref:RSP_7527 family protein n=1 Tax=Marinomonas shanghaiensis TaxID=2202418 RepID=UPI003A942A69
MNNNQSIAELLKNVNTAYLTDAEKYEAIARAERAEYIVASVASAIKAVKNLVIKIKSALVSSPAQHA